MRIETRSLLGWGLAAACAWGSSTNVQAACVGSVLFGQGGDAGTGYSYIVSPGANDPASLLGSWWALGSGNPVVGAGDDVGSQDTGQWLRPYSGTFYMGGDWIQPGTDGCISEVGFPSMVAAFSDESADGSTGYFAVAGVDDTHGNFALDYDFSFVNGGAPQDVTLVEIPTPNVLSADGGDPQTITLAWSLPQILSGIYTDPGTDFNSLVTEYQVYFVNAASDPASRALSSWTQTADLDGNTLDGLATISVPAPGAGESTFIALGIGYDSGFSTEYVSASAVVAGGSGITVTFGGSCPGAVSLSVTGATPGGIVAFLRSPTEGSQVLTFGPCAGTQVDIINPTLLITAPANGAGEATVSGNAPGSLCGLFVQAIDASTCAASDNVVQFQ